MTIGRPTNLTPELTERIVARVVTGSSLPTACEAEGISWNTAKDWVKRGRAGAEPYAAFVAAWQTAKAQWKASAITSVNTAGAGDWRASAWLLERRCKEFAAPRHRVELTGKDGGPIALQRYEEMSTAELAVEARKLLGPVDPDETG